MPTGYARRSQSFYGMRSPFFVSDRRLKSLFSHTHRTANARPSTDSCAVSAHLKTQLLKDFHSCMIQNKMANQTRALQVLKDGGKLVNGLVCLPSGGVDLDSKGRLTADQLNSLEKKGAVPNIHGGTTIHTYKNDKEISLTLYPKRRHQSRHRSLRK